MIKTNSILNYENTAVLYFLILTFAVLLIISGCSETLNGDVNENQKPIVQFVNIPPEGQLFSRNPEVYWFGTDNDGLLDYYRYHIETESNIALVGTPMEYALQLTDDEWTQINIVQTESDPQTSNVLSLTADTTNPVSNAVGQYVFLQGFDTEGLGSDIVYRLFNRNDNPPQTFLKSIAADTPYVNSVLNEGVITGVRLRWTASDRKDYEDIGLTPPPFDYEWRLFGPFPPRIIDSIKALNTATIPGLLRRVVVTEDAQVLEFGDTLYSLFSCEDTVIVGPDTSYQPATCTTKYLIDNAFLTDTTINVIYTLDTILDISDPIFDNKEVRRSSNGIDEWVQDTTDIIFNVYSAGAPDTTIEQNFLFWIRSRDDALVKDLTPEYVTFPVINPKYERDIAVIDFSAVIATLDRLSAPKHVDTAKAFWYNLIHTWAAQSGVGPIIFDTNYFTSSDLVPANLVGKTGIDYIVPAQFVSGGIPFKYLLKHKMLILYNDQPKQSGFASASGIRYREVLTAMDAGISAWGCWRNALPGSINDYNPQVVTASPAFSAYFGVASMTYSNWIGYGLRIVGPTIQSVRLEDFVGAYSIDENQWPNITIDTALLHSRMAWPTTGAFGLYFHWIDSIAALPEVNWSARSFGTEVMYLYKSKYGNDHFFGQSYNYEGSPVAHKFESNLFRSVHQNFTLLAVDSAQAQTLGNTVLSWLYNPNVGSGVSDEGLYPQAFNKISIEEARARYSQRIADKLREIEAGGSN